MRRIPEEFYEEERFYLEKEDLILIKNHKEVMERYKDHKSLLRLIKELKLYKRRFIYYISHMRFDIELFENKNYLKTSYFDTIHDHMELDLIKMYPSDGNLFMMLDKDISFAFRFIKLFKKVTGLDILEEWLDDDGVTGRMDHWVMDGRFIDFEI